MSREEKIIKGHKYIVYLRFAIDFDAPSREWVEKYLEEMIYDFRDVDRNDIPNHTKITEYEIQDWAVSEEEPVDIPVDMEIERSWDRDESDLELSPFELSEKKRCKCPRCSGHPEPECECEICADDTPNICSGDPKVKKLFKVGVSWEEYGYYEIEAETAEEALAIAEDADLALPNGSYVEGSFKVDHDCDPEEV